MAIVIKPNGDTVKVNNLGWLLRNRSNLGGISSVWVVPFGKYAAYLSVDFNDGTVYRCHFESYAVCRDWARRHLAKYAEQITYLPGSSEDNEN